MEGGQSGAAQSTAAQLMGGDGIIDSARRKVKMYASCECKVRFAHIQLHLHTYRIMFINVPVAVHAQKMTASSRNIAFIAAVS